MGLQSIHESKIINAGKWIRQNSRQAIIVQLPGSNKRGSKKKLDDPVAENTVAERWLEKE
jgi:hypothetical protein